MRELLLLIISSASLKVGHLIEGAYLRNFVGRLQKKLTSI